MINWVRPILFSWNLINLSPLNSARSLRLAVSVLVHANVWKEFDMFKGIFKLQEHWNCQNISPQHFKMNFKTLINLIVDLCIKRHKWMQLASVGDLYSWRAKKNDLEIPQSHRPMISLCWIPRHKKSVWSPSNLRG